MEKNKRIHIGTSGWDYKHWVSVFYPENTREKDFFKFYSTKFKTAEINSSFYHLPSEKTVEKWKEAAPHGFLYAVKASRYITHMKKLKDPRESVSNFFSRIEGLEDTMGPVLFQLPPNWHFNGERLEKFLKILPEKHRYVFEFRDSDWFREETYEILKKHNAAFCIYDLEGELSPLEVTADFTYIRLHGPQEAYEGSYSKKALTQWAERFLEWEKNGKEVFCYFDNDEKGYAPKNALKLIHIINHNKE